MSRHGIRRGAFFLAATLLLLPRCGFPAPPAGRSLLTGAPDSPIALGDGPGNLVLGKVNQDAKLDLVVASGGGLTVFLGQGDGRFRAAPGGPITLPAPSTELVSGEFNGDGKLDLAVANHDSYGVVLLIGDGNGGFTPAPNSPVVMREGPHAHTHGLNAGDLNGDGAADLVSVNSDDHDVSIALGDGKGGFTRAASTFPVARSPYPAALGDLNADGHPDIVVTSSARNSGPGSAPGAVTVLLGDGRGGFSGAPVPLRTVSPGFVAVADVNGDRKPDLVATHLERRELTILTGDGKGGFTEITGSPFDLGGTAWQFAVADLNGDGKTDVAAGVGDGVRVMIGDGRGGFQPAPGPVAATGKGTWQLAAGDVNGDGRSDVVTGDMQGRSVTVLLAR